MQVQAHRAEISSYLNSIQFEYDQTIDQFVVNESREGVKTLNVEENPMPSLTSQDSFYITESFIGQDTINKRTLPMAKLSYKRRATALMPRDHFKKVHSV